jgi:FkbM family methyltransferase
MAVHDFVFAGLNVKLDDTDGKDLAITKMLAGTFEPPLPLLLMAVVDQVGGDFVDVGANSGLYTVLAGLVRKDIHLLAFEPNPPAVQAFKTNVALNSLEDRADLRTVALSDREGTFTLYSPDQSHGLLESGASLQPAFSQFGEQIEVEVTKLDQLALEKVGVVKVDIETHEPAFFRGGIDTFKRTRPVIFFEVLPQADMAALNSIKQELGFRHFRVRPDSLIECEAINFDPQGWNHALVPPERYEAFSWCCTRHNIELLRKMVPA